MIGERPNLVKPRLRTSSKYVFGIFCLLVFFEFARPQSTFSFLAPLRLPGLLSLFFILYSFLHLSEVALWKDKLVRHQLLFCIAAALSFFVAVNNFYWFHNTSSLFIYLLNFTVPMIVLIDSVHRLRRFLDVLVAALFFTCLYIFLHAGKGPGSFIRDENDAALVMCVWSAICYFLSKDTKYSSRKRKVYFLFSVFGAIAVVATASRGGFLGLLAVGFGIWWYGENRLRRAIKFSLVSLALLPIFLSLIPDSYVNEVKSISDTEDRTRNERFRSWRYGFYAFLDNPVLGIGVGNYPWRNSEYRDDGERDDDANRRDLGGRQAHSLWFTLIPELGLIGIFLYIAILQSIFKRSSESRLAPPSELTQLSRGVKVAIFSFLINGTFISVLYYPVFWFLVALHITLRRLSLTNKSKE